MDEYLLNFYQRLLNRRKLVEDEHFFSYFMNVLKSNGLDYKIRNRLLFEHLGFEFDAVSYHVESYQNPINDFVKMLEMDITPLEFYMKTTEIKLLNFVMEPSRLDYFWLKHYRGWDSVKHYYSKGFIFNMCPECMKQEGDRRIIHLSHQLPFVKVCHIHNTELKKYYYAYNKNQLVEYEESYIDINHEVEFGFAKFMKELNDTSISYSLSDLIVDMNIKMETYPASYYMRNDDEYPLKLIFDKYMFIPHRFNLHYNNAEDLFKLMYFIYRDPTEIKLPSYTDHYLEFTKHLEKKYELISEYNETLIELKCLKCGYVFITTVRLILYGHQCPNCTENTENYNRKIIQSMEKEVYQNRYKIISYDHDRNVVKYENQFTGSINSVETELFMTRSLHRKIKTIIKAPKEWPVYSKYSSFNFLHRGNYVGLNSKDTFMKALNDLTADEYELIGEYKSIVEPVDIKHHLCGRIIQLTPLDFVHGKRCKYCKVKRTPSEIVQKLNKYSFKNEIVHNYSHSVKKDFYRLFVYEFEGGMPYIFNIYQFTEELLLQEILRNPYYGNWMIFNFFNKDDIYEFFYQKDINLRGENNDK